MFHHLRLITTPLLQLEIFNEYILHVRASLMTQRVKEYACQCRSDGFDPWSGKIPHAMGQLGLLDPQLLKLAQLCSTLYCAPQKENPLQ